MVDRFPVVLRGYDKEKVDAAFDATQESMKRAQQTLASMREQIAADDDRILQLQAQLQEEKNKKPEGNSFASLGANAQQMLASAEQTSTAGTRQAGRVLHPYHGSGSGRNTDQQRQAGCPAYC